MTANRSLFTNWFDNQFKKMNCLNPPQLIVNHLELHRIIFANNLCAS